MRKDYIYQDRDQYRLLQNATRIGGFYAGDQGVIPAERVLPEQRFAHQPVLGRPEEMPVSVFSYLHNKLFSTTNTVKVANTIKKSSTGTDISLTYGYTGWEGYPLLRNILLKNWTAQAQAITYSDGLPIGTSKEGASLTGADHPVFFKKYLFFHLASSRAVFYSKLKADQTETKEIKVAVTDGAMNFYYLCWLYEDTADLNYPYKMAVYKQTAPSGPNYSEDMVQYKANNLEGPWAYDKTWNTYIFLSEPSPYPQYTAIVQELAALLLSKTHKELSLVVNGPLAGWQWALDDVLRAAYFPPFIVGGGTVHTSPWSRGNEGEIINDPGGYSTKYLIKRSGGGQIKKTPITSIGTM